MKRLICPLFFSIFFLIFFSFVFVQKTSSDELSDITKQIQDLTNALDMSIKATKPLESQLNSMKIQISEIKNRLAAIEQDIFTKEKNINEGYKNLAKQEVVLNRAIRDYYIKTYYNSPFLLFLSSSSFSDMTRVLAYQKAATDQDKAIITNIALSIQDLEAKKKALENEKATLVTLKSNLDEQSAKLDKIVQGAKAYQENLTSQIAVLSARQQQILAQRLASLNIPLFASAPGACSSDIGKDPGFSPKFGFFTYGVRNRVGLNQWGAYGRANSGQSYDTILRAYYNFSDYGNVDENTTIKVNDSNGYDSGNTIWTGTLNQYVKRIWEVPESWPSESLRAQVIAIRSYVMAQTNNGSRSICANTYCQVFKDQEKGGAWNQAVDDTSGKVMVKDGQTITAWFSSTHGGYVYSSGGDIGGASWTKNAVDTTTGSAGGFSDLNNNAYDKDSPWFYCDWGARSQYNGTAWLKPEEVADIVNVLLLAQKDSSTTEHLYQTDKPNPAGTDTWDTGRVKQELQNRNITPYNNISDISVSADFGSGFTTSVTVNGDAGSQTFTADAFVTYFDLRAPATIYIPNFAKNSDGSLKAPLFNVER